MDPTLSVKDESEMPFGATAEAMMLDYDALSGLLRVDLTSLLLCWRLTMRVLGGHSTV
jgi:hypothetical protein